MFNFSRFCKINSGTIKFGSSGMKNSVWFWSICENEIERERFVNGSFEKSANANGSIIFYSKKKKLRRIWKIINITRIRIDWFVENENIFSSENIIEVELMINVWLIFKCWSNIELINKIIWLYWS